MINFLREPLIRTTLRDGARKRLSLPEVFSVLADDSILGFEALRPHQRHVWHAFLVQIAAQAAQKSGNIPKDENGWRVALRALTSDWCEDEPWSLLVDDLAKPALLQPPVPEGSLKGFKNQIMTPDAIDILVSAKNHDLKQEVMARAEMDGKRLAKAVQAA
jgi:CRISPR system Cascade subunit CasA